MKQTNVKYTNLRSNTYWLHYRLPSAIYNGSALSSPLIRYSLNTEDTVKASTLAPLLVLKVREFCTKVPSNALTNDCIKDFIESTLIALGEKAKPVAKVEVKQVKVPTLSQAYAAYKAEALRACRWRAQTEYDNCISHRVMLELIGDVQVDKLTVDTCRNYRDALLKYPVQRHKSGKLSNKALPELLACEPDYDTLSLTTVNNHLRRSSSFLNWIRDQGYDITNPLSRMKVKQTRARKSCRVPFTNSDLNLMYSTPVFTNHRFSQDYQFWLPLLGLYTGARLEELCQLHVSDIQLEETIPNICIDDRFSGQKIKSESSRRQIPIHKELLALGFADFVRCKHDLGQTMLFGYLVPQRNKYGHQPSKWFGRYKTGIGITDSRKVFHSFRHTLAERLRQKRVNDYEIKAILGHATGSITHDIYGSDQTALDAIQEALHELSYIEITSNVKPWVISRLSH